ncbi:MAG: dicarboxylate/amino acid:cation symporter [Deltaproteobacteria bacterium]|nr:dicarboxylate/amino acid:cation symporter [Deltaproteobacteria bacterium]
MQINFSSIKYLHPRSLKYLSESLSSLVKGRLWLKVLIGMFCGILLGILIGPSTGWISIQLSATIGNWLALPGQIFLSLIQMIVIPLVVGSIIRGLVAVEDIHQLRKLGSYAVVFFIVTTLIAIILGIGLAYVIQPGNFIDPVQVREALSNTSISLSENIPANPNVSVTTHIIELIPKNLIGAMLNSQMLQIVLFAIIVGIALLSLSPSQSKPILELLGSIQEVCMTIVRWAMYLAPYAVFGLMTQITTKIGLNALFGMSIYVFTVLLGLLFLLAIYLAITAIFTQQKPLSFLRSIKEVQLLAFSTSSSAAVMPLSMKTAEENLALRPSIAQFVIPLGTTINMAGTALYQGVATIFLAQVFGIDLSLGALSLVVLTAVAASIGSPGTPGVGIVILSMVLSSAGIPSAGIALIIGVDRILDMSRTALNVTGDLVATLILNKFVGGKKSAQQELEKEKHLEIERSKKGEDVIIKKSFYTTK